MFLFVQRILKRQSGHVIEHEDMLVAVVSKSHSIIDVREPHEYESGHISDAVNMPLSRFSAEIVGGDLPVILVCQTGRRSAKALALLKQAGHFDARHYALGTGGWHARGGKLG